MSEKKVLLLLNDKDPVLTRVSKMKYEKETGWQAIIPSSYDEGVQLFAEQHPDLVVTEIILNDPRGRSGYDFVEEIKAIPHPNTAKIVVLTDLSQAEDKAKAAALGISHYYVKSSISLMDFISELRTILAV